MGIKAKPLSNYRERYHNQYGYYPNDFSHFFGGIAERLEYLKWDKWHTLVDAFFPDYFPFNTMQGLLQSILDQLYAYMGYRAYVKGVKIGEKLTYKFDDIFKKAKNKIETEIRKIRNYAEKELFAPLKDKINNELMPKINKAEKRIKKLNEQIDLLTVNVNTLSADIRTLDTYVDRIRIRLDTHYKWLNDLERRVKSLEEGKTGKIELPAVLRW